MFPFGCVFCLSRLAGRNINISNDSIKKIFWCVRFLEWKNSEGKVCYVGNKITANGFQHKTRLLYKTQQYTRVTYRENDVDNFYFNSSCRKWFNSWIISLLHYALMGCCEVEMELKAEKYKGISWPADWLSTYLWSKSINGNQSWLFAAKSKQCFNN
jgi:hypothetical protein